MDEDDFYNSLNSLAESLSAIARQMKAEAELDAYIQSQCDFTLDDDMSGIVGPWENDDVWPANVGYSGASWEDEQSAFELDDDFEVDLTDRVNGKPVRAYPYSIPQHNWTPGRPLRPGGDIVLY